MPPKGAAKKKAAAASAAATAPAGGSDYAARAKQLAAEDAEIDEQLLKIDIWGGFIPRPEGDLVSV
jgi:hypothetical protein